MHVKPGVDLNGLQAETLFAMSVADRWFGKFGKRFTVTSGLEGKHKKGSKHYTGHAFDLRTRHLSAAMKTACARDLQNELGDDYDVVVEPTHIHCEYDKKGI